MNQPADRPAPSGQYTEMQARIEKVAIQALRTAAKASKAAKSGAAKASKTKSAKRPSK